MDDNHRIIFDLLKEVREDQKNQNEKIAEQGEILAVHGTHLSAIQKDMEFTKKHTADNRDDLREHMRRTDILERMHEDNKGRIDQLEQIDKEDQQKIKELQKPLLKKKWMKEDIKWILTVLGLLGGLVSKIMGLW